MYRMSYFEIYYIDIILIILILFSKNYGSIFWEIKIQGKYNLIIYIYIRKKIKLNIEYNKKNKITMNWVFVNAYR